MYWWQVKHDKFILALQEVIERVFKTLTRRNFTHMIHDRAFEKMESILNTTSGNVIIGASLIVARDMWDLRD